MMAFLQTTLQSAGSWLNRLLFQQKLVNPLGFLILALGAVCVSVFFYLFGLELGALFTVALFAIPIIILCLLDLKIGLALSLVVGFLVNFVAKYSAAPMGIGLDGLLFLMLFGVIYQAAQLRDWQFPKSSVSVILLVWLGYSFLMVLNPLVASKLAWLFTVRSMALMALLYFISCYAFKDLQTINFILKVIIALATLAALYGLKQEYFGYSDQEWAWLHQSRSRYRLIVQWGRFRVFSLFSDPTSFGTLMAYCGSFCFIWATGPISKGQRALLLILGTAMFLSMAYAGSRTPFLLVPVAVLFYTLLTLDKKVIIGVGVFFLLGTAFVMKSTGNATIYRIQSAFRPTSDASVQVRLENQKMIQPFIQSHPFGAGLGTTGVWGERFSPNTWLAGFAHDSAYVRVAVEMGWVGLIIYLAIFFITIRVAIYYYFRVADPLIKTYYLGLAVVLFMIALSSYPQEVVPLLPTNVIFFILLAMLVKLKDFDPNFKKG